MCSELGPPKLNCPIRSMGYHCCLGISGEHLLVAVSHSEEKKMEAKQAAVCSSPAQLSEALAPQACNPNFDDGIMQYLQHVLSCAPGWVR